MSSEIKELLKEAKERTEWVHHTDIDDHVREYLHSIACSLLVIAQILADVEFFEEENEEQ